MPDPVSRSWTLFALIVAQMLGSAAAGMTITAGALTATALADSTLAAGAAQAAGIAGAGTLSLPVAFAAARWGRKRSLALAYGVATAGGVVAAAGVARESLAIFILGMICVGGGTVGGLALRFAAADLATNARTRPRNIALVLWSATIGSLVGPNLVALSGGPASSVPFLFIGSLYAVAGGSAAIAPFPARLSTSHSRGASRRPWLRRVRGLDSATRSALRVSTAGHMSMVASMGMAPVFLDGQPMIHADGIGLIMSGHLVAMYGASPVFGALVRRFGAAVTGRAALCTVIASCAVLSTGAGVPVAFALGLILLGLGWSLGMVASSSRLAALPPPRQLDAQGLADLLLNVGGGLASIVAGLLMNWAGYPALVLCVGAAVAVAVVGDVRASSVRPGRGRRGRGRPACR